MAIDTLIIDNVDLELLEKQRCVIGHIVNNPNMYNISPEGRESIAGISHMLDEWSDQIVYKEKGINNVS